MAKHKHKEARGPKITPEKERFPGWLLWPLFFFWGLFIFRNNLARFTPDLNSLFFILSPQQYSIGGFKVLLGHASNMLSGLAFLFSCFALGRLSLRLCGFSFLNALEEGVFAEAAGLGLFSVFMIVLGVSGLLYPWAVAVPLLALAVYGVYDLAKRPPAGGQFWPKRLELSDMAVLALLLFSLLFNLAGALGPEIFYDSLVYHLAVPGFYAIKHKITQMSYNLYSNLPLTHGMLYTAALLVKDEILAKLINYSALVFTAAAVLAAGTRYLSWRAGLWGALIFYTVFHTMATSWTAGTEALLTFFSVASLYALLNHKEEEKPARREPNQRRFGNLAGGKWLWLAACFAGLAMGVKYTGLFPALGVMLAYAYKARKTPLIAARDLAVFTLIASFFVAPWLIKNYVYKHNPVYPFATGVFGLDAASDPAKVEGFLGETRQMGELKLKDWVMHPWNITIGKAGNSEYFSPLFLFLLPFGFMLAVSPPAGGGALTVLWLYFLTVWLTWSCASTMVRFLMPAYPAAGLLMAHYLFSGAPHKALKGALKAVVILSCLCGVYWSALVFYTQGRYKPVLGQVSKKEYLSRTQPGYPYSHYAAMQFINDKPGAAGKTLIVGDGRSFYMKKDFIVSSVFDKTPLVEYAAASNTGEEMYERMKADGITHLLLNVAEAIKLGKGYRMFYFDDRSLAVFNAFWAAHAREVFFDEEVQNGQVFNRTAVYELAAVRDPKETPPYNFMSEVIMKNINPKIAVGSSPP
ncbi:MAG: phospholipid carrier-dependent glycosyltransferase [Elusimicrobia bacterium]|nr:phospholipid carrier-dependent glycosyltransferase [Elusimicrobiota bacterium]